MYWYNKASDLLGSAGAVWAAIQAKDDGVLAEKLGLGSGYSFRAACWPVYLMLCGMAFELLLKAILVAQGKEPPMQHKLVHLAMSAGLTFSEEENGLLELLSEAIYWYGRYPVPKCELDFDRTAELIWDRLYDRKSKGSLDIRSPIRKLDWESFRLLWARPFKRFWELHS